jgi:hypothetical protein
MNIMEPMPHQATFYSGLDMVDTVKGFSFAGYQWVIQPADED